MRISFHERVGVSSGGRLNGRFAVAAAFYDVRFRHRSGFLGENGAIRPRIGFANQRRPRLLFGRSPRT
ncbi:hypothetical protein N599_33500 [Saccharopolyspora erythraea D]|nr:hypothetical protein N599_33500 [Saccharopolyspora erythraea D]